MSEAVDGARKYSERHALKQLLHGLDVGDLYTYLGARGDTTSIPGPLETDSASKPFAARCAEVIACHGISEPSYEQDERMFGDLAVTSDNNGNNGRSGGGRCSPPPVADRGFLPFMAEVCSALAQHYSCLTTGSAAGSRVSSNAGPGTEGFSLQDGIALSFAVVRTWVGAGAPLWRSYTQKAQHHSEGDERATDEVDSSHSAAPPLGESFLHALLGSPPAADDAIAAEEIALLLLRGHLPELSARVWDTFLKMGRAAAMLQRTSRLSTSLARLTAEVVATRCLLVLLCDAVVAPTVRELVAERRRGGGGRGAGTAVVAKSVFLPPPRVMREIASNAALLESEEVADEAKEEPLRTCLAILFADAFFVHLLKPYPTLVANAMLTGGK